MDFLFIFISFVIWFLIWYLIFYIRYENKKYIDNLRKQLKECKTKLHPLTVDLEEYKKQNEILKSEIEKLLLENKDLKEVVWYFSRYLYLMKKAHENVKILSDLIKEVDPEIEWKIEDLLDEKNNWQWNLTSKKW